MRHCVEDHEAGIDSCAQESAVQVYRAAHQGVALAGDEKRGRHAVQVGIDRRKYGIFRIGVADIVRIMRAGRRRIEMPGKAAQRIR